MPGPYDGLRVIEFGRFIAAPYAAQLLADGGAEVDQGGAAAGRQYPAGAAGDSRGGTPVPEQEPWEALACGRPVQPGDPRGGAFARRRGRRRDRELPARDRRATGPRLRQRERRQPARDLRRKHRLWSAGAAGRGAGDGHRDSGVLGLRPAGRAGSEPAAVPRDRLRGGAADRVGGSPRRSTTGNARAGGRSSTSRCSKHRWCCRTI